MASGIMLPPRGTETHFKTLDSSTILEKLGQAPSPDQTDAELRDQEQNILQLGERYREEGKAKEMSNLIKQVRPFLKYISKAKAAKLVRGLVDMFLDMERAPGVKKGQAEVQLCNECIDWAKEEKRIFLRQSLESRLIGLFYETERFAEALALGAQLLKELKKLDDKNLLVEVQLLESKTYASLGNIQKARAALTSARTTANSIYIPPKIQAQLDMQAGILHASEERDFKTAFSYFYEAFEQYDSIDDKVAITALKYMLMSKIMLNVPEEVLNIVSGKLALKYSGSEIEAMKAISLASKQRSLADFQKTLASFKNELEDDKIVNKHLGKLYQTMLEQNLCRIIEPYSKVQVNHIAEKINLPSQAVEKKLSQMILDHKFQGILDQETGVLIIFQDKESETTYDDVLETINAMSRVVDRLYQSAQKLS